MDDAKASKGWTDREILCSLLYLIQKDNITFDWEEGLYPVGRKANGFRQKINSLKNTFKPDWDAMASGAPVPQGTPKKVPATPRKRKSKAEEESSENAPSAKKPRGRSSKKATTSESEEDQVDLSIKAELKEEPLDDIDVEI